MQIKIKSPFQMFLELDSFMQVGLDTKSYDHGSSLLFDKSQLLEFLALQFYHYKET